MNTEQIRRMLTSDCNLTTKFSGVYASDQLPSRCDPPVALVANLDPSRREGSHWVAIYIDEDGVGDYFDSYGLRPGDGNFVRFFQRNCTRWSWNQNDLQSLGSSVCGHYCIWFLGRRAEGYTMQDICNEFTTDTRKNDAYVRKMVVARYGNPVKYNSMDCQSCYDRHF